MKKAFLIIAVISLLLVGCTISPSSSKDNNQDVVKMPAQSYLGTWYTDEEKLDDLVIWEITNETLKFSISIFRTVSFEATAKIEQDQIVWNDTDGIGTNGLIDFQGNSIEVIVEKSEFPYILSGSRYEFKVRE